jgi:hypothetical protein
MNRSIFLLVIFLIQIFCGQEGSDLKSDFIPGHLRIYTKKSFFKLPKEAFGVHIRFANNEIVVDSVKLNVYHPEFNHVISEKTSSKEEIRSKNIKLANRIKVEFSEELSTLFEKYGVYSIARLDRNFAPEDTIPRYIYSRNKKKKKLFKEKNRNRELSLRFSAKYRTIEFANELKKCKDIDRVEFNSKVISFDIPNDPAYADTDEYWPIQQHYMGPSVMNFEEAWDYAKGSDEAERSVIAFLDTDFTDVDFIDDLWANRSTFGPIINGGNDSGHGTRVVSVACAVSDNFDKMAGATYNSFFVPFLISETNTIDDIINNLDLIMTYLDDDWTGNDIWLINMSLGLASNFESIKSRFDELYEFYDVITFAGVGNNGDESLYYPAAYSSVVGVGASNYDDSGLWTDSNRGSDVEVVATGEYVYVLSASSGEVIASSGTSVATPFASSVAALILSTEEGFNLTNVQIRDKIKTTADQIYDSNSGKTFRRINAYEAVKDVVTGIGDGFLIEDGPVTVSDGQTVQYLARLTDTDGSGSFISTRDWSISFHHFGGTYRLYNNEDGTDFIAGPPFDPGRYIGWEVTFDTALPDGYQWTLTENGGINGKVECTIVDSDGAEHESAYHIMLDVVTDLSSDISSSTTLDGYYFVANDIKVKYNSTVTINPGSMIYLADDARITIESGSRIIANGNSSNPVYFLRQLEEDGWDRILIYGSNNQFTHCVFDGGRYNVDVRSTNNQFTNCSFTNAERGFMAYRQPNYSWSSFQLTDCEVYNNDIGVYVYSSYGGISGTSISQNANNGLYVYNARIGDYYSRLFINNYIANNGMYGIELASGGRLQSGYGSAKGYNQIINNGSHEVYLASSTTARFYDNNGAYSSIYQDDGSGYYIYNLSKTYNGEYYVAATVTAEKIYWGSSSAPSSSKFYGPVDRTPYLSSDPTSGPMMARVAGETDAQATEVLSSNTVASISHSVGASDAQRLIKIKQKILELKQKIKEKELAPENARRLNDINNLIRDFDPENSLGERPGLQKLLIKYVKYLEKKAALDDDTRLIGEAAMVIDINSSIENGQPNIALRKIQQYRRFIKNSDNKREMLYSALNAYIAKNKYEQALVVLGKLKKETDAEHEGYAKPSLELIESALYEELGIAGSELVEEKTHRQNGGQTSNYFELGSVYPNPFNPTTSIPFHLKEASKVKISVYDILGRQIKVLTNQQYLSGSYSLSFDGNGLASGIYFVQAEITTSGTLRRNYSSVNKLILMK